MISGQNHDLISYSFAGGLIPGALWDVAGTSHFLDRMHVFVNIIKISLSNVIVFFKFLFFLIQCNLLSN